MNLEPNSLIKAEGVYYAGILNDIKKHTNPLQPIFEAFIETFTPLYSICGIYFKADCKRASYAIPANDIKCLMPLLYLYSVKKLGRSHGRR